MGFWEDLSNGLDRVGRRINDFGEDAARATREFSQQQKLKTQIADEKRLINTQYLKLGKKYFEEHQGDTDLDADAAGMIGKIVRAQNNIREYEAEIEKLKETGDAARAAAAEAAEAEEAAKAAEAEESAGSAGAKETLGSAEKTAETAEEGETVKADGTVYAGADDAETAVGEAAETGNAEEAAGPAQASESGNGDIPQEDFADE